MDKTVTAGAVEGVVVPPSSKSYAQRAIAAGLLARGTSMLSNVEMCDDTTAALRVVQHLGARVEQVDAAKYIIHGGLNPTSATLDIGESGLSTRLFTPIAALCPQPITITGHGSILARPMDMMTEPLRKLGVRVKDKQGRLPITVRGPMRGGEVSIDGSTSSQFLTGLLMALPLAAADTTIYVEGLRSLPYIDMTIDVMDKFGIDIDHRDYEEFYVPGNQVYTPAEFEMEGDWSAASCLLVAGAVAGSVTVRNLKEVSLQADVAIIEALSRAGARIESAEGSVTVCRRELQAFEFDATDCPDLFPALAALAANCEGTSIIKGTDRLVHKESNRAETLRSEYGKLGIEVDIEEDNVMKITGGRIGGECSGAAIVKSHGDHRIAMSLAVAALNSAVPVVIKDAECVSKSYYDFWEDFNNIRKAQ
jgi:3-phosphoshikimate 1-carboxyvinyltransferase